MWIVVITCAANIVCGLHPDVRSSSPQPTESECLLVGNLALELAGYDKSRFVVRCEKVGG